VLCTLCDNAVIHLMQYGGCREYRKEIAETNGVCNLSEGRASSSRKEQGLKQVIYIAQSSCCGT